ncbi:hypothetical protein FOL47_007832 [Perkinsus chesapeaki]|uniref:Uncharacterized protein n=1 Tax=Perkinsus chesapeaki TaxID=330153 RepID=A0A7J6MV33_PERCH|nr:hypothetical protein FOL47_007832 [Perkinsus chesapeaki]
MANLKGLRDTPTHHGSFDIIISLAAAHYYVSKLPLEICSELWSFLSPSPTLLKTSHPEAYFRSGDSVSISYEDNNNLIISRNPYVVGLSQLGRFPEFAWATNCDVLSVCGIGRDGFVVSLSDSRLLLLKRKMLKALDLRAWLFRDGSLGPCVPKVIAEGGELLYLSDRDNKCIVRVNLNTGVSVRSPVICGAPLISYEFAVLKGLVFVVNLLDSSVFCWDSLGASSWLTVTNSVPRPRGLSLGLHGKCLYVSSALDEHLYRVLLYDYFKVERICYIGQAQQLSYSSSEGLVALVNTYFNRVETWQETSWMRL